MATADCTWLHPSYKAHEAQLKLVSTIYNGIDTAKSLILKLRNESDLSFSNRIVESTLDNYIERIVTTMSGQINRKGLTYEEIPDNIIEAFETIGNGHNLNQFAKNITDMSIRDGKSFVLVDIPIGSNEPQLYNIQRHQLTNWVKDDEGLYTLVVIKELYKEQDGRFGFAYKVQYRVIDAIGNVEIWREVEGKGWLIDQVIITTYDFCPFYEISVDEVPPLYDIARINAKHLNFTSLRDRFLKEALDPILFGQNLGISDEGSEDNPTIIIGVNNMMSTDNPDSNLSWVELDGKNYDISERHLIKLEDDMGAIALKVQSESSSMKTATQVSEESSESTSRLSDVAEDLESLLNACANAYSLMKYSKELDGKILTNRDFNATAIDSNALTSLNTLQVSGNLSKRSLLKAINDSEYVDIEDIDEEMAMIEEESLQAMEEENARMEQPSNK